MTRIIHAVLLAPLAVALPLRPVIAQRGTPAEARAMLAQAVAHYRKVGRDQALADFTAKKAPFVPHQRISPTMRSRDGKVPCSNEV